MRNRYQIGVAYEQTSQDKSNRSVAQHRIYLFARRKPCKSQAIKRSSELGKKTSLPGFSRSEVFKVRNEQSSDPNGLRLIVRAQSARTQSRCQPNIMRPLVLSFIVVVALLSLLVVAQINLNPYQDDANTSYISNGTYAQDNSQDSASIWYDKLLNPIVNLLGCGKNVQSGDTDIKFIKIEQGYLNHRRPSISSFDMSELPPRRDSKSEPRNRTMSSGNHNGSTRSQLDTSPSSDEVVVVDKVKGLDLSSIRTAKQSSSSNRQTMIKRKPYQNQQLNGNDPSNVKCHNNKHDRVIAQRISLNDLSRPIVTPDGRYDNPFPTWSKISLIDVAKFMVFETDESNIPKNKEELDKELPLLTPNFTVDESKQKQFRVTWIGHSTLLIQIDGMNILTDPIFSERASPYQFVGPKRIREPACTIKSLPQIDIVLISHNHYDHLDANSVKEINERFGNDCRWIVPLGLGDFLQSMSVENYVELDWWQKDCFYVGNSPIISRKSNSTMHSSLEDRLVPRRRNSNKNETHPVVKALKTNRSQLDVYLTPSQHWSRRGVADVNKSLWGSFTIVSSDGSAFFFGGDTGYCMTFKEIGKIFGPFVGAAIPIGAYKPRWFLKPSHVDPAEAVQIHRDLRSAKSIAIHHSTFVLSNENYKEPANLLRENMEDLKVREGLKNTFVVLAHGETIEFCRACEVSGQEVSKKLQQDESFSVV